jgi:hypothetical protein
MTRHNELCVDLSQYGAFRVSDFSPFRVGGRHAPAKRAGAGPARGVRRFSAQQRNLLRIETSPPGIIVRDQKRATAADMATARCIVPRTMLATPTPRGASARGAQRAFITLGEGGPSMQTTPSRPRTPRVQWQPILSKSPGFLGAKTACLPAPGWWIGRINLWSRLSLAIRRSRSGRPPYGLLRASS